VVLTPKELKGTGMYNKAVELAEKNGWFLASQFETAANAKIHENTTAREIMADFKGKKLDYWVSGYGTGGTVTRAWPACCARKARTRRSSCPSLPMPRIDRLRHRHKSATTRASQPRATPPSSHTRSRAGRRTSFHLCCRKSIDKGYYDELVPVAGADGIAWSRKLAQKEGIFTGVSGGSTFAIAMGLAEKAPKGTTISVHAARHRRALPVLAAVRRHRGRDVGRRSTNLSASTPGAQMKKG
jgi:cysteine synthase A